MDYRVDTPEELATAFQAQQELGLQGRHAGHQPHPRGVRHGPRRHQQGHRRRPWPRAKEQGIHGKATTPFLLAKVKELTGGDSLDSNIQLVYNNAALAAKTACELCKMD